MGKTNKNGLIRGVMRTKKWLGNIKPLGILRTKWKKIFLN